MRLPRINLWLAQYSSEKTKKEYQYDLNKFIDFCGKQPENIEKIDFLAYLEFLKEQKFSKSSIVRYFNAIRSYWKFLLSIEVLQKDVSKIKLPSIKRVVTEGLTDSEVKKIIKHLNDNQKPYRYRDKAVIYLMLYNGLRRSEVCKLKIGDILTTPKGIIIVIQGKGEKVRKRPLHCACFRAIADYLKQSKRNKESLDSPLFVSCRNQAMSGTDIYNILNRYVYGGMRNIHPHMLRGKFASMALEAGVPITSVAEDLGHASIETTVIYDKAKSEYDRSAILKIKEIS